MSKRIAHLEVEGRHLVVELSGKSKILSTEEFEKYIKDNSIKVKK